MLAAQRFTYNTLERSNGNTSAQYKCAVKGLHSANPLAAPIVSAVCSFGFVPGSMSGNFGKSGLLKSSGGSSDLLKEDDSLLRYFIR